MDLTEYMSEDLSEDQRSFFYEAIRKLSYSQLVHLIKMIEYNMHRRPVIGYKCCDCGFTNTNFWEVVFHLKKTHGYPDEDANIGTGKIYK